jgi:hypothetical protein
MDDTDSYSQQFKDSNQHLLADVVTQCLTTDCIDCTGSYSNEILNHRWICFCPCHQHLPSRQSRRIVRLSYNPNHVKTDCSNDL